MFILLSIMLCGVGLGLLLRRHRLTWIGYVTNVLIWLLLFLLGAEAGSNPQITGNFHSLGIESIAIAVAAVAGSAAAAWGLWKTVRHTGKSEGR